MITGIIALTFITCIDSYIIALSMGDDMKRGRYSFGTACWIALYGMGAMAVGALLGAAMILEVWN